MHLSTALSLSLLAAGGAIAQAPAAISINVAGQSAPSQSVAAVPPPPNMPQQVGPGALTQQGNGNAQQQPAAPAVTVVPGGAGAGSNGTGGQQQPQQPQQGQQGAQAPGGAQEVWVVKVGSDNNDLVFSPNTVNAQPGQLVQFQFFSRNHSVVSSTFEQPCQPDTANQQKAFFSGFMPTAQGQGGMLTYTVPVRDTEPIWFYCSQARHCQDGMVGVINPPTNDPAKSLQAFAASAQRAAENSSPNGAGAGAGTQQPGAASPQSPAAATLGGITPTATAGAVAQSTRSAATTGVKRMSWNLAGAAALAWCLL